MTHHRCEEVRTPRDDQGIADSLVSAYRVDAMPDELRRLVERIR